MALHIQNHQQIQVMNRSRKVPKLELRLNLSPPRASREEGESSPRRATTASPPSSCISSDDAAYMSSPEATSSMILAGCPRCLMYVMLSGDDPKCPKCKSGVLLDFLHEKKNNNTKKKSRKN